ncbi:MAG: WG repeat-containing protein [Chitinophagales bacterium]|nr:WG repeat-containing protein [Chitinophagales bacterium]
MKLILKILVVILIGHSAQAQMLIPYRSGALWGYCTPDKKIVIPPRYERAEWFSEGMAAVAYGCYYDCFDVYDGLWAFIDVKGNEVLPAQYEMTYPFIKGTTWVQKDGLWRKINKEGKVLKILKEWECRGCVPREVYENMPEPTLPKGYHEKRIDNKFIGYYNDKGTEYWDDPETVMFFNIDTIIENDPKGSAPYLIVSNRFYGRYTDNSNAGKKLKPSIAFITYQDKEIKAENVFPLGEEDYSDEVYVKIKIPEYEKLKPYILRTKNNPNKEKLLIATSVKIPMDTIKQNLFFNIFSKGINFYELEYNMPLISNFHDIYEMTKAAWQQDCLSSMVLELQKVGTALKEQGDPQNKLIEGKENPYNGKMLFDIMESATQEDVMEFLKYVSARPFLYMGQWHAFAEVFATWVDGGAPRVVAKQ